MKLFYKATLCCLYAFVSLSLTTLSSAQETSQLPQTFKQDLDFLKQHTPIVLLDAGDAAIAVAPAYQGRVMTSTFDRTTGQVLAGSIAR
jgi:hypothetical protein